MSRTAPGKANLVATATDLGKFKAVPSHNAWEEFLQKASCKMIWIVEDRPFGGLARYGEISGDAAKCGEMELGDCDLRFDFTRRFWLRHAVGIQSKMSISLFSSTHDILESDQSQAFPESVLQARKHQAFFQVNVLTCKSSRCGITNVCDMLRLRFQYSA